MEVPILVSDEYTIYEADSESIQEMAEFVVLENYRHHLKCNTIPEQCVKQVIFEEQLLSQNSRVLIVRNKSGLIIGSIRINKWDKKTTLPIEKLFGIKILNLAFSQDVNKFWHIGRFAISHRATSTSVQLMITLILYAVHPIVREPDGCLIAEVDRKLYNILCRIGMPLHQLAPSIQYLASETIPVFSKSKDLLSFYNKYKHRCAHIGLML